MQLIETEKYGTLARDFLIHTYRDNNTRIISIEPTEVTNGKNDKLSHLNKIFTIKDEESLNLKAEEYENYSDQLAEVKQSIIFFVNQQSL